VTHEKLGYFFVSFLITKNSNLKFVMGEKHA